MFCLSSHLCIYILLDSYNVERENSIPIHFEPAEYNIFISKILISPTFRNSEFHALCDFQTNKSIDESALISYLCSALTSHCNEVTTMVSFTAYITFRSQSALQKTQITKYKKV